MRTNMLIDFSDGRRPHQMQPLCYDSQLTFFACILIKRGNTHVMRQFVSNERPVCAYFNYKTSIASYRTGKQTLSASSMVVANDGVGFGGRFCSALRWWPLVPSQFILSLKTRRPLRSRASHSLRAPYVACPSRMLTSRIIPLTVEYRICSVYTHIRHHIQIVYIFLPLLLQLLWTIELHCVPLSSRCGSLCRWPVRCVHKSRCES